ncbi:MAG TPA: hypothetical protein VGK99_16080 [Acidobacteriota bacterium]
MKTKIIRCLLGVLFILGAAGLSNAAQTASVSLSIRVEGDQLLFVPQGKEGHFRLEIFGPGGEAVFDSGLRGGQPAGWNLRDMKGEPVNDGVYIMLISTFSADGKEQKRMEQLILAPSQARQNPDAPLAAVLGGGTPGKVAKWTGIDTLGDSVMTEDLAKVGVNLSPLATLHVDGAQGRLSAGPGFDASPLLQTSGGKGGNTSANATAGKGGDISLLAGIGGDAAVGTSGNGGNITLQPGSPGAGAAPGQSGRLYLAPFDGNVGVGTLNPASKLTVEGMLQINGANNGVKFPDNTTQTTAGLITVAHNATLTGDGTNGSPLGIINQGIDTPQLKDASVTSVKIAPGQVVKSLNALKDDVLLVAGSNVAIAPGPGNSLSISASNSGLSSVTHNATLTGDGTNANPLGVAAPLGISGSNAGAILSVSNAGTGAAISAGGAVDTSQHYGIGGNRVLSVGGSNNVFAGVGAGANNSGVSNAFFGAAAGQANTLGNLNSFFGAFAGLNNTGGSQNSFFGNAAGQSNTQGVQNSFFGTGAGAFNTTGINNSFFGFLSGRQNTTGFGNAFFGHQAGRENTTGQFNSFFGSGAGLNNTTGSGNVFLGILAGFANSTGSGNTFVGNSAGSINSAGNQNAFFGVNAGLNNISGDNNSFFGSEAGLSNITNGNSFFGALSGRANTSGVSNAFFGYRAGRDNVTGGSNSFFGSEAGRENVSGGFNSFFGRLAGGNNTGDSNSFFGALAGRDNTTADNNAFFGSSAGRDNTTGTSNSFFGRGSGLSNTTGDNNTAVGRGAGSSNTTENGNTFIGALTAAAAGVGNGTAIGYKAMVEQDNTIVLGSINGKNGAGASVRVGIGTTQPQARLHVNGIIRISRQAFNEPLLILDSGTSPGSLGGILLRSTDPNSCYLLFIGADGTVFTSAHACP